MIYGHASYGSCESDGCVWNGALYLVRRPNGTLKLVCHDCKDFLVAVGWTLLV